MGETGKGMNEPEDTNGFVEHSVIDFVPIFRSDRLQFLDAVFSDIFEIFGFCCLD